jgi:hypothetical protein
MRVAAEVARVASAPRDAGAPLETGSSSAAACVEKPARRPGASALTAFDLEVTLAGNPLRFGETNALPGGVSLTPSNLRFYASEFALMRAGGTVIPVDLVQDNGTPLPYNVHLVNLEAKTSLQVRLAAPPGEYEGLTFLFGLTDACNMGRPDTRKAPLNDFSQMTWPHAEMFGLPLGYLFLRYEGLVKGPAGLKDPPPPAIHMGGLIGSLFAPLVTARGRISIAAVQAKALSLRVAFDQILLGATQAAKLDEFSGFGGPEVLAGERLRQNAARLPIFSVVTTP